MLVDTGSCRQLVRLVTQPIHGSELLAQYRTSGSPDVFAQIMRAYGGMVFSVCYKVTKDAADAEDASQAAFLTLAVQCKTGATITYLGPWLKKVAKRSALDLVRSRKRRTRREAVTAENRPEFFSERSGAKAEAAELSVIIRHELDQLPAKYRMPLVLHYFGGMSHEQIAKEMACTPAALGVRLHRARKMLGKRLTAKNISLEGAALGLAIAAAIHHVVSDRFVYSTQLAVMSLNATMLPGGPIAGLPAHLGAVTQIVAEVGQSMARARMKMAAISLVAGITMLGGAAEAVHHLPESLRANLDFLAPSQILQNLIRAFSPAPELHLQAAPAKAAAPITIAKIDLTRDHVSPPPAIAPPPQQLVAVNQPILALQVPPNLPQVVSTFAPLPAIDSTLTSANFTPAKTVQLSSIPIASGSTSPAHTETSNFRLLSVGTIGGSSHGDSSSIGDGAAGSGGGHRGETDITDSIPLPNAFGRSQNISATATAIGPFDTVAVSGGISGQALGPSATKTVGPVQPANGVTPDSVVLKSNDVFVHAGAGTYHWADPAMGITAGGTNSADFTLGGAVGDGVVTISRLPVTTTLAPVRPTGHHFVGIWSIDSTVDYSQITLTAHYDESFAEALGLDETILKLWVYDDGQWIRIMDSSFSRNLIDHTLTGTYNGMPTFFAVSAPEPAGALLVLGGSVMTLLRRRRLAPSPV